ncbi:CidA/LrgA family protein [Kordiimonas aquimaris]|uniref:CidA/LrgA family protein n=1 Tax=Kordiimonas aquimaris TaxID=707591 RepID=UPI0021CEE082|nr:CidA/LrgA family protein [Kordiimonas aquimaris]
MKALIGIAVLWGLLMTTRYTLVFVGFYGLPAAIVALAVLTVLVVVFRTIADLLEPGCGTLIQYMPLFFIPVLVGVTVQENLLAEQWVLIVFTVIGATLAGLMSAMFAYRLFAGRPTVSTVHSQGQAND